jgi:galactokinase/mevalonate kinase-like predicted kinase
MRCTLKLYADRRKVFLLQKTLSEVDEEQMITEKQLKFIENYCETGDAVQSAISAGYKNSHTIVNQAWKLKRDLSKEISKRMQEKFVDKALQRYYGSWRI